MFDQIPLAVDKHARGTIQLIGFANKYQASNLYGVLDATLPKRLSGRAIFMPQLRYDMKRTTKRLDAYVRVETWRVVIQRGQYINATRSP